MSSSCDMVSEPSDMKRHQHGDAQILLVMLTLMALALEIEAVFCG
jgi:hypothetical protein